ncbi:MAG TPA: ABC transporter permease [Clostridia bacterium]|nr:ABC transporter permease [Clostridia bacterium]HPQ46934.1 ABC transporter permease [Clostridia bacterium]
MKKDFTGIYKSLGAVILGLIAGGILMAAIGANPFKGFLYLFMGGIQSIERIGNVFATATTLILTGLSVAFAFRTGLFNIGAAGQMLIGGLCATIIGLSFNDLPRVILLVVMFLAALLGGAIWGIIPGLLKARFNVHEVVATIMMNWIAYWVVYYVIKNNFTAGLETESASIPAVAQLRIPWLTELLNGSYLNLGIVIAVAAVIVIKFILDRTTLGYELKAVGYNRHASRFAGIKVNRSIILSMMIAGGLAGLAGLTYYTGYSINIQIGKLPTQGFDGIAVALLGATSPWGVFFSATFFGLLHAGKGFMSANTSVPPQISDTIIAIIIYFTATSLFIENIVKKLRNKRAERKALKAAGASTSPPAAKPGSDDNTKPGGDEQ